MTSVITSCCLFNAPCPIIIPSCYHFVSCPSTSFCTFTSVHSCDQISIDEFIQLLSLFIFSICLGRSYSPKYVNCSSVCCIIRLKRSLLQSLDYCLIPLILNWQLNFWDWVNRTSMGRQNLYGCSRDFPARRLRLHCLSSLRLDCLRIYLNHTKYQVVPIKTAYFTEFNPSMEVTKMA